jgi:hypothetical protein
MHLNTRAHLDGPRELAMSFIRDLLFLHGFPSEPLFGPTPAAAPQTQARDEASRRQAPACPDRKATGLSEPKPV